MLEMRYLWQAPLQLDNRKLVRFLGKELHTPVDTALRETLLGLGCLRRGSSPPLYSGVHSPTPAGSRLK
jgi:hypothetical protein